MVEMVEMVQRSTENKCNFFFEHDTNTFLISNANEMRKLFLTLICCLSALLLSASSDTMRYLSPKDTVFVTANELGQKFLAHPMEKGQTIYSLARFYGLKPDAVFSFNPDLPTNGDFTVGQQVRIPIPDSAIVKFWKEATPSDNYAPVYYVVKQGDTFYRIANVYFKLPLDTLLHRNNLTNTSLSSGQSLHIGWLSVKGIADTLQLTNTNPLGMKMADLKGRFEALKALKKERFHNGAAYWQREKKGNNDYFALHRLAPVGSVIEITNPMKKKTVYAKVLAPIPDRAYGDDIVVVLSPTLAKLLDAKDAKFFVEIKYFTN